MGVRKRKPMVNYTWLNVDFENSFGVDYLQQPLKWKGEPPIKCLQYKTIQYLFIYDLCQPILNKFGQGLQPPPLQNLLENEVNTLKKNGQGFPYT